MNPAPWPMRMLCAACLLLAIRLPAQTGGRVFHSIEARDSLRVEAGKGVQRIGTSRGGTVMGLHYARASEAPATALHQIVLSGAVTMTIDVIDSYCGSYNGSITVHASDGTAPYTYSFDGGFYQSSALFITSGPSDHTVSVKDAAGKVVTRTMVHVGNNMDAPSGYILSHTSPTSCNSMDGSFTLAASGGVPPYQYSMDLVNWQSGVFSGLPDGDYSYWVRDANGCISDRGGISFAPCLSMSMGVSVAACGNTAGLTVTVTDSRTPPDTYGYSLDGVNWQSVGAFTGLGPGMVTLQIKDFTTGQVYFFYRNMGSICSLTLDATSTPAVCGQANGTIVAVASQGAGKYEYSIDGLNFQSSPVFSGLAKGEYTVVVRDQVSGLASLQVSVDADCPTVSATATAASCANNDGVIKVTGGGGKKPYTYSIDGVNYQTGANFTGLAAGNYTISLKDALGAIVTTTLTVTTPCLQVTATTATASCGLANGSLTAVGHGGTAPYNYSIDGTRFGTSATFTGLIGGTYTVTLLDNKGIKATTTITVGNIAGPTMTALDVRPVNCKNQGGSVTITASGGTAPLNYSVDGTNYLPGNSFAVGAGDYVAYVQDAIGCVFAAPAHVALVNDLTLTVMDPAGICPGDKTLLAAQSNAEQFSWSPAMGLDRADILQPHASPSVTTQYTLTATTGLCQVTATANVSVNPVPVLSIGNDTSILTGQPVPMVVQELAGGGNTVALVSFTWTPATGLGDPSAGSTVARPLVSTEYTVVAMTEDGCQATASRSIKVFAAGGLLVPKAFSPNGDGHNDVLHVRLIGMRALSYFAVFNRWGQRVFMTEDANAGWDGRVGGRVVDPASYVWEAAGVDYSGKTVTARGIVVVVR